MMNRLLALILWTSIVSCSAMSFREEAESKGSKYQASAGTSQSKSADQGAVPETRPSAPLSEPKPRDFQLPPGTAVIPVAVGGSSLTCYKDPAIGMLCRGTEPEVLRTFKPSYALYASEMERIWFKAPFYDKGEGLYAIHVPKDLLSTPLNIAVMLVDSDNRALTDTVFEANHTLTNMVKDPSFEELAIDAKDIAGSRVVPPSLVSRWKAQRLTESTAPCLNQYELDSMLSRPERLAAHGDQWVELVAGCDSESTSQRERIGIYQSIPLLNGNTYRISFAYRKGGDGLTDNPRLRLIFDGQERAAFEVKNNEWAYKSLTITAANNNPMINFQEYGSVSGQGSLIDDIIVVDLTELARQDEANAGN
jgi:hypothetical protein